MVGVQSFSYINGKHPLEPLHPGQWDKGFVIVNPALHTPQHDTLTVFEVRCEDTVETREVNPLDHWVEMY